MPNPLGRPSRLTKERVDRFVEAIRIGSYVEIAATLAGLDRTSVYRYMARGREAMECIDHEEPDATCEVCVQFEKDREYRDFHDMVKQAEAQAEQTAIQAVRRAGLDPRHWTSAMTFLERRFRDRWARPAGAMLAGDILPSGAVPVAIAEPDDVDLRDRLASVLEVLDRAGKLHDAEPDAGPTNGHAAPAGIPIP